MLSFTLLTHIYLATHEEIYIFYDGLCDKSTDIVSYFGLHFQVLLCINTEIHIVINVGQDSIRVRGVNLNHKSP